MENLLAEQYYMEKETQRRYQLLRSKITRKYLMSTIATYLEARASDEPKCQKEEGRIRSFLDSIDRDCDFEYHNWKDRRSIGPNYRKQMLRNFVRHLRENYEREYFDSHSELCSFAWGITVKLKKCGKQTTPPHRQSDLQEYKYKVLQELEQQFYAEIASNLIVGEEEYVIGLQYDCETIKRNIEKKSFVPF